MDLEKSSSSAVTGKPLPASMQPQTSTSYFDRKDTSLVAALEKAKERVQEMVKKRNADVDSELVYPTFKKSRVVPKSSGPLTEDDTVGTDTGSKKKSDMSSASRLDDTRHHVGTDAEGVAPVNESQKNDAEPAETNKAKKSLPFIGKLPFLKAARTAKQAANEQNAADDKNKIDIKVNVSQSVTTVQSEPTSIFSDIVVTSAQEMSAHEQAVPDWPAIKTSSCVETSNSLDAFLSIGDPDSGQSQAVPVLSVGPQTWSEFLLQNPPDKNQTAGDTKTSSLYAGEDVELANSSRNIETAVQSVRDITAMPNQSTAVTAGGTDKVTEDAQLTARTTSLPSAEQITPTSTSSPADQSQTNATSAYITSMLSVQTMDTRTVPVSEAAQESANATTDTGCIDNEDNSAMSLELDDNTEDYEPENNAETEQVAKVPRDEETAKLLPQISASWMVPAASGHSALSS